MSLKKNKLEKSSSNEVKAEECENSAEGLILKELPNYLKYTFLEPKREKSVIILAALTEIEEQKLLEVLRRCKEAIA